MIAARNVTIAYGARTILEDASLDVRSGELLALVGPNGAGKTSLLRALTGVLEPSSGSVAVDGVPVAALSPRERGRRIAVVESEGPVPAGLTVRELVANGRLPYRPWWRWTSQPGDEAIVDEALEHTALTHLASREFTELSTGERQRAWIAVALAQRTATIVLDEPTSHLDIRHAFEVLALLRALAAGGTATAAVLHDLNLAAGFADRIAVLGGGTVLAYGSPREALRPDVLARAYGVTVDVIDEQGRLIVVTRPAL